MSLITQLERTYHFTYPADYMTLYQDNMLDWWLGWNEPWTKERNWYTEIYPKLKEHPPLLLHNSDFELLPLTEVAVYIDNRPDYWDPKHSFIPFGVSGSGDWYAFYNNTEEDNNNQLPVVLVLHDMDEVQLLSANLTDFIFRQLVEITCYIVAEDAAEEEAFKTKLRLQLNTHKNYLSAEKVLLLEKLYAKPINTYTHRSAGSGEPYNEYGILTSNEVTALLNEQIGFPLLNHTFRFHIHS